MSYTFFRITVPDGHEPRGWAKRMWDAYGFDYTTEKFSSDSLTAWALDSDEELREALDEDDIEYSTFEVEDLDSFFGIGEEVSSNAAR